MDSKTEQELAAASSGATAPSEIAPPRRKLPYRSPELKRLGAVADLTLGTALTTNERSGFKTGGL